MPAELLSSRRQTSSVRQIKQLNANFCGRYTCNHPQYFVLFFKFSNSNLIFYLFFSSFFFFFSSNVYPSCHHKVLLFEILRILKFNDFLTLSLSLNHIGGGKMSECYSSYKSLPNYFKPRLIFISMVVTKLTKYIYFFNFKNLFFLWNVQILQLQFMHGKNAPCAYITKKRSLAIRFL